MADRPRCPDCHMPHDLTPDSLPMVLCARILADIRERDFDAWEHQMHASPGSTDTLPGPSRG
ncbi:hypothetical protein ACFRH6_14490 [Streptomyces sp. NPDC056749]|uniref:hypothetical protein n=1 Tax=Streptomyces sp. NPDC056749 TaxID=3345936 RepID=UPI0036981A3D